MHAHKARGFSLIELAIVIAIVGIIAAIAIPRLSRGAEGASESALTQDLARLQTALEIYQIEHGGSTPTPALVVDQLTRYTDAFGGVSASADATHIYGPYLREVPALPIGIARGSRTISPVAGAGVAWVYDPAAGTIRPNTGIVSIDTGKRELPKGAGGTLDVAESGSLSAEEK